MKSFKNGEKALTFSSDSRYFWNVNDQRKTSFFFNSLNKAIRASKDGKASNNYK